MKKNVIVGQSGGPTAVINASLYGVVNEALNRKDSFGAVFGMINGIEGFAEGRVMDMEELKRSGELELVKTTPGSYLGSCRYKLPKDLNDEVYPKLFERFKEYDIGYFFYIGGNDSMDTVAKLSDYLAARNSKIRVIGIPKTTGEKAGSPVIYRAVSPLSFQMFYGIDFFRIVRFYICMSQLAYQEPVIMKSPRGTRHHNSVLQSRRRLFQLIRRNI